MIWGCVGLPWLLMPGYCDGDWRGLWESLIGKVTGNLPEGFLSPNKTLAIEFPSN